MMFPNQQPSPGQVLALSRTGMDAQCGCCCCGCCGDTHPMVSKIPQQYALPLEAQQCVTLQEVNQFVEEINHILEVTHVPIMPLMLLHFVLPFSPICVISYMQSQRQQKLVQLIETKNLEAVARNFHWELRIWNTVRFGGRRRDHHARRGRHVPEVINTVRVPMLVLIRHDMMNVAPAPVAMMATPMTTQPGYALVPVNHKQETLNY